MKRSNLSKDEMVFLSSQSLRRDINMLPNEEESEEYKPTEAQ